MKICRHLASDPSTAAAVNQWLWPHLMPELWTRFSRSLFLGCGGLIASGNPALEHYPRIVVFGAGARDLAALPDMGAANWDIRFVRGPDTARALGLPPERWLCDPAVMIPKVHGGRGRGRLLRAGPRQIAFAPGPGLTPAAAATLAHRADLRLLPHDLPPEGWIDQLLDCDAAICGDLTVAATADAYGIPWRPLRIARSPEVERCDTFEWRDLCRSMGLTPCAVHIAPLPGGGGAVARLAGITALHSASRALQKAVRSDLWSLSDRSLLRLRQQALAEEVADLRLHEAAPRRRLRVVGAAF